MDNAQTAIYVAIRTSPRRLRFALASKNPIEEYEATRKLTERVIAALKNFYIEPVDQVTPNFSANCGHRDQNLGENGSSGETDDPQSEQ